MPDKKITSRDLKELNSQTVFSEVYALTKTSKQELAYLLHLSMPTINQNLKMMEEMNFITRDGRYESTGGRKAQIISFNSHAKISIGVELLKESVRILAIDLYGTVLKEHLYPCVFSFDDAYFRNFGAQVNAFIYSLQIAKEAVLGVKITIQGLLSMDSQAVVYAQILACTGMTVTDFQKHIDFPCSLVHDTEASAFAELWFCPEIKDAVLFMFNRDFGGSLIINGETYRGKSLTGGVIEHLSIAADGPACYCGKKGCLGAFCSLNALREQADEEIDSFFSHLRNGDRKRKAIWDQYLSYICQGIDNIRMIVDCDFIFAGHLFPYFTEDDFLQLEKMVHERCVFSSNQFHIHKSRCGTQAPAMGAALLLVENYLISCGFQIKRCKQRYNTASVAEPLNQ